MEYTELIQDEQSWLKPYWAIYVQVIYSLQIELYKYTIYLIQNQGLEIPVFTCK